MANLTEIVVVFVIFIIITDLHISANDEEDDRESFSEDLVQKLGLEEAPQRKSAASRHHLPQYVRHIYRRFSQLAATNKMGKPVVKTVCVDKVTSSPQLSSLEFDLLRKDVKDLTYAELTLERKSRWRHQVLHPLPEVSADDDENEKAEHVNSFHDSVDVFDVTSILQNWQFNERGFRLNVTKRGNNHNLLKTYVLNNRKCTKNPHLLLYKNITGPLKIPENLARSERSSRVGSRHTHEIYDVETSCRLHSWNLYFVHLGWDWVLHPESFPAGVCRGGCDLPNNVKFVNASNHAYVVSKLMARKPRLARRLGIPAASCVPLRGEPLSVMYVTGDGGTIMETLTYMVITSCGCL